MDRRVVITGMGAITPLGNTLKTTWDGIVNGRSGVGYVTIFNASTFPVKIAGEVKNFSPDLSQLPEDFRLVAGRSALLCLETSKMALDDSGLALSSEDAARIGISLGGDEECQLLSTMNEIYNPQYVSRAFAEGGNAHCELLKVSSPEAKIWALRKKTSTGAMLVSLKYNIRGPVAVSHTSCSSSGHALGRAKRLIENNDCDIVLSGGHCSMISEFSVAGFHLLGTLSTQNENPQRASRPFDLNRDGFVIGEGAGILVLEELNHAKKRGAHIYAELSGFGSSSNAYRLTDTPPDGTGGDISMQRALKDARTDLSRVDYINAHGTATLLNDRSETLSIKKVFADRAYTIPISSSKSMIGHLVCCSSAVELVITAMSVQENIVPPTINLETRDPLCDLDYVPNTAREQQVNVALSNSFAFGGQNATLVVEKFKA